MKECRVLASGLNVLVTYIPQNITTLILTGLPPPVALSNITRLVLSHNKITTVPPELVELRGLEYLNLFNNLLEVCSTVVAVLVEPWWWSSCAVL